MILMVVRALNKHFNRHILVMCKVRTKDLLAQGHYEKKGLCKVATKRNPHFGNALNQRALPKVGRKSTNWPK